MVSVSVVEFEGAQLLRAGHSTTGDSELGFRSSVPGFGTVRWVPGPGGTVSLDARSRSILPGTVRVNKVSEALRPDATPLDAGKTP